jgi:hypothetical protein
MKRLFGTLMIGGVLLGATLAPIAHSAAPDTMFVVRSTTKTPEAVVDAVKAYAEGKKWQYLGADKVKQGQVTLVKLCIPEVGQQIWPVGLHLSAMLPCGNLGVYQKGGATEMSLLHPRYMPTLYPDPALDKASAIAEPLLLEMFEAVAK